MSTLKLSVFGSLFVSLALAACVARGDGAAPTQPPTQPPATVTAPAPTAEPSVEPTSAPTAEPSVEPTAEPTSAPTVEPTPAPTQPAPEPTALPTPDPNEGVGEVIFEDAMDGLSGWHWGFADEVVNFGVDTEREVLAGVMTTSEQWWRFTLGPDGVSAGDQQVTVNMRAVACEGDDEYGLVFRGQERAEGGFDLYVLKLRCSGAARFESVMDGRTTVLVDWTAAPAIHGGAGAENRLTVWMQGGAFRFYANSTYLFSAQDEALDAGYYGFYLFDRTGGGLSVNFDDLVAREVGGAAAGQ